jgi:hypothetical protein
MMKFEVKFGGVKNFSHQTTFCSQEIGVPHEAIYWFLLEITGLDNACTPVKSMFSAIFVGIYFI